MIVSKSIRCWWLRAMAVLALAGVAPAGAQTGRQFYAAPGGIPSNDGSLARPLDLATALSASSPLRAGDTLWLRGGRYVGNFTSVISGTPSAPIVVRQYFGERATLDAATANRVDPALSVRGADVWFWGFEVTDSTLARQTSNYGADPKRGTSVDVTGARTRFINMVVHDGAVGFGVWTPAVDAQIYGSIIANVGVEASDRGHGHSIYVQNDAGAKRIVDNFLLYSFSFGVHAYTEGARVDNIQIEGNTIVGAGLLSARSGAKANILTGGRDGADFTKALGNVLYYSPLDGRGMDLNYGTPCANPEVRDNYVVAETTVNIAGCSGVTMTGNTFYGFSGNLPSLYPSNTYLSSRPTGIRSFVRPNTYEPGRANITILNWDRAATVAVDVSAAGLSAGTRYEVRDARNFYGPAVATGTYSGAPITLPMTGLVAAPPIGNVPIVPPHTAPELGTFVLLPLGAPAPPPPSPLRLDAVTPNSGPAGGGSPLAITGAGFDGSTTVYVGAAAALAVNVHDATHLSATVPQGVPGIVDVTVARGQDRATRQAAYTYLPQPPALQSAAVAGTSVTLQWAAGTSTPARAFYVVAGSGPGRSDYGPFPMGLATTFSSAVAPGRYWVRVVADTPWGALTSNEVLAIVGATGPPPAPTLAAASVMGPMVTLRWSPATDAASYVVVARLTSTGAPVALLPVTATEVTVQAPSGTYYVSVLGLNGAGTGPLSNQIQVSVR